MPLRHQLLALVVPPLCAACRSPLPAAAGLVCSPCLRALPWLGRALCRRCGLPSHGGHGCPAAAAAFVSAWAPLAHTGSARALVHALKFRRRLAVAELMAAQVAANAPTWARGAAQAVVPVPAAPMRRRRRGFDAAELLAGGLARRLDLPLLFALRRGRAAPRQLGAGRSQRRARGRLAVRSVAAVPPVVLLVDDVHTTGATLGACAAALRDAGAECVHAITYARTLRTHSGY